MAAETDPEPEQPDCIILVGQDRAGHWLVQDCRGFLEGRFISRAAAFSFARAESRCSPAGRVVLSSRPLVPHVPFGPMPALDRAA